MATLKERQDEFAGRNVRPTLREWQQKAGMDASLPTESQLWLSAMNPLNWEKTHQVGFAIAVALGFIAGFLAARAFVDAASGAHRWYYHDSGYFHYIDFYWPLVFVWAICGAMIAAALVYMTRLLRS